MILFLAANPRDTGRLALDQEARSIHVELKRSGYRDRFDFQTRWAAEPLDLLREMRELKPTVVHFSGHGSSNAAIPGSARSRDVVAPATPAPGGESPGLLVHDASGSGAQFVSPEAIAQTLGAAGASVRLVVLNACYTASIAEALLAHVDCVVGMTGPIHDDAARTFAIGFYGGLGEQVSVAAAFKQGNAAISLEGLSDAERPQLQVRAGFDAAQLILTAAAPSVLVALPCPYPGMRPFTVDDAASFHGRDYQIDDLIDRLRAGEREIYVIGPSGSGKSSLVAAGVLPRLARGVAGLGPSVVRTMRPGEQPAARLSEALNLPAGQPFAVAEAIGALLAHRNVGSWVLLVIDQLEELFTQTTAGERDAFLSALRALRDERRCAVIVTLRADFFGALMESPLWPERVRDQLSRIEVSPLRGEALREAIAAPSRDAGVAVDPELIERLLADAASEPGTLPLMQETMIQLWNKRADQTLTLADYKALGDCERSGLAVALSRRADATLRRFSATQTGIARRILLRLVSFGEGRSDTRRQQPRAQLRAAGDDAADFAFVLQTMVGDRLLTVDEDVAGDPRVDLAHEIMISAWPQLRVWLGQYRRDELERRELEQKAAQWTHRGRGPVGLLDIVEVHEAETWLASDAARLLGPSPELRKFATASRNAFETETRRRSRKRRRALAGGAIGLLLFVTVVVVALRQTSRATSEAARARAQDSETRRLQLAEANLEQGREAIVDGRPLDALGPLTAARTLGLGSDRESIARRLFAQATQNLWLTALRHDATTRVVLFSSDGRRVATASDDMTARIWEASSGLPLTGPLAHTAAVTVLAFSSDGRYLASSAADGTLWLWDASGLSVASIAAHTQDISSVDFDASGSRVVTASKDGTARIWDVATGRQLTPPLVHLAAVRMASFNRDGTRVATASGDKTARIWDVRSGQALTLPLVHRGPVASARFSPDGSELVTASWDHEARIWDVATGHPRTSLVHDGPVAWATYSDDGRRVATASRDRSARVWDAVSGEALTPPLVHGAPVALAMFCPDGTRVVTASDDHTARFWDSTTGRPLTSPLHHPGAVGSASLSPDCALLATAGGSRAALVWDARPAGPTLPPLVHSDKVIAASFSSEGTKIVTASVDRSARIWDARTGLPLSPPLEHAALVHSAEFSPDERLVVTASDDRTAALWTVAGQRSGPALTHAGPVTSAQFAPDGLTVVTTNPDGPAQLWTVASGDRRPLDGDGSTATSAAFSRDGRRVVTTDGTSTVRIWDVATARLLRALPDMPPGTAQAEFSPDGALVVTASSSGIVQVWSVDTGRSVTAQLRHRDAISSVTFSPDGATVLSASDDQTAQLWNVGSGLPVGAPLAHDGWVESARFSPDGAAIVTASRDGTARLWDARSGRPLVPPFAHLERVNAAAFSANGLHVVTASDDHQALVWDVAPDQHTLAQWRILAGSRGSPLPSGDNHTTDVCAFADAHRTPASELDRAHNLRASARAFAVHAPALAATFLAEAAAIHSRLGSSDASQTADCVVVPCTPTSSRSAAPSPCGRQP